MLILLYCTVLCCTVPTCVEGRRCPVLLCAAWQCHGQRFHSPRRRQSHPSVQSTTVQCSAVMCSTVKEAQFGATPHSAAHAIVIAVVVAAQCGYIVVIEGGDVDALYCAMSSVTSSMSSTPSSTLQSFSSASVIVVTVVQSVIVVEVKCGAVLQRIMRQLLGLRRNTAQHSRRSKQHNAAQ
jgi:hypothetical protein